MHIPPTADAHASARPPWGGNFAVTLPRSYRSVRNGDRLSRAVTERPPQGMRWHRHPWVCGAGQLRFVGCRSARRVARNPRTSHCAQRLSNCSHQCSPMRRCSSTSLSANASTAASRSPSITVASGWACSACTKLLPLPLMASPCVETRNSRCHHSGRDRGRCRPSASALDSRPGAREGSARLRAREIGASRSTGGSCSSMSTISARVGRWAANCASIAASVGCAGPPNGSVMVSQAIRAAALNAIAVASPATAKRSA